MTTDDQSPARHPGSALLSEVVRKRREALGLTQEEVAQQGGPSLGTQRSIENAHAERYQQKTLHSIDDVLGWTRGTSLALLGKNIAMNAARKIDQFNLAEFVEDAITGSNQAPAVKRIRHGSGTAYLPLSATGEATVTAPAASMLGMANVTADATITPGTQSLKARLDGLDLDGLRRLRDMADGAIQVLGAAELRTARSAFEHAQSLREEAMTKLENAKASGQDSDTIDRLRNQYYSATEATARKVDAYHRLAKELTMNPTEHSNERNGEHAEH